MEYLDRLILRLFCLSLFMPNALYFCVIEIRILTAMIYVKNSIKDEILLIKLGVIIAKYSSGDTLDSIKQEF